MVENVLFLKKIKGASPGNNRYGPDKSEDQQGGMVPNGLDPHPHHGMPLHQKSPQKKDHYAIGGPPGPIGAALDQQQMMIASGATGQMPFGGAPGGAGDASGMQMLNYYMNTISGGDQSGTADFSRQDVQQV